MFFIRLPGEIYENWKVFNMWTKVGPRKCNIIKAILLIVITVLFLLEGIHDLLLIWNVNRNEWEDGALLTLYHMTVAPKEQQHSIGYRLITCYTFPFLPTTVVYYILIFSNISKPSTQLINFNPKAKMTVMAVHF